jgi:hypothetical protein
MSLTFFYGALIFLPFSSNPDWTVPLVVSYKDIEKKLDKKTGAAETQSFLLAKLAENLDL